MSKFKKSCKVLATCVSLASASAFAGMLEPVELPWGYVQLEYVESTGAQFIDTGVRPDSSTTCTIGFTYVGGFDKSVFLMGCRKSFKDCAFYLSHQRQLESPNDGFAFSRGDKIVYSQVHNSDFNTVTLTAENKFLLNDAEIGDLSTEALVDSGRTIYLFALNNDGVVKDPANIRLYSCDIMQGGELVRSFVPVRHFGIAGLYDLVGGKFYFYQQNTAGDRLVAGPERSGCPVRVLPAGYTQLEYVRSTGSQMLNTEIVPDGTTEMYVRLAPHDTQDVHMVGSRTAYQVNGFGLSNNSGLTMAYGTQVKGTGVRSIDTMVDVVFFSHALYLDGGWCASFDASTFTGTYPMYVFTINNGGSPHAQYASIDLAELHISTNGVAAREYVAAMDSQGTLGLYDFVSGRFFTCSRGTLTPGAPLVDESLVPSDEKYENDILSMQLSRESVTYAATDITLAYGAAIGGATLADWEDSCVAGAFAAGERTVELEIANLPESARYGCLFTKDGSTPPFEIYTLLGRYERPSLPAEYRMLEYIRSLALSDFAPSTYLTPYIIDTKYIHQAGTQIECVADIERWTALDYTAVFGVRMGASWTLGGGYAFFTTDNSVFAPRYSRSGDKVVGAAGDLPYGEKIKIVTEGATASWYSEPMGEKLGELVTTATIDAGVNTMAIFDVNDSPTVGQFGHSGTLATPVAMKLYSFRMIDDGRVSRDFIPCLNEYGEPGLYETVKGTFHGNLGDGEWDFETDLPTTEATYTWTGAGTSANWSDAANWSRSSETAAEVPGWSSTVVIPSGTWTMNLDRSIGVRALDLSASDTSLKITVTNPNAKLLVRGDLTFGAVSDPARQGLLLSGSSVEVSGNLVAGSGATELPLRFVVPVGGYASAPFSVKGSAFTGAVRGRVYVDAKSPALKVNASTLVPLVSTETDMVVDNVVLETLPKRKSKKDSVFVWDGVRALGVMIEGCNRGLMLIIRSR